MLGQGPLDEPGYTQAYDQAMVRFNALKRLTERYLAVYRSLAGTPAPRSGP